MALVPQHRDFQVFVKAGGALCNLGCRYCYYLPKKKLYPDAKLPRMETGLLERYIRQHFQAHPGPTVSFSWHGGEPTLLGVDYFRQIVALQKKLKPPHQSFRNGIQTNGTLLDETWCRFLAEENFQVGLSLDGPPELHNLYRLTVAGAPTHERVMRGYTLLRDLGVSGDILCVVHAVNVRYPLEVYRFFKQIQARYLTFIPLVIPTREDGGEVSPLSVPSEEWGEFLCKIFDEWKAEDIGRIQIQIFEEALRTAFGREHSLCIFRKTCGDIPVIEHNGDFYACDHFVEPAYRIGNIRETPLAELLESGAQRAFGRAKWESLPGYCRKCEVLEMCYGGCPKDRILRTPEGDKGWNVLCAGYRRFFNHCRPFVAQVQTLWRSGMAGGNRLPPEGRQTPWPKVGRNDPCPCGSGLKYKKCCLGKTAQPT